MHLWNVSFSLSKNCLLGSILPVVSFLLDHSIDSNTPLVQPSVSAMSPPKSFSFENSSANCKCCLSRNYPPPPSPPSMLTPVTTSFTFTRNLSSRRFGLSFQLCTVALSFFCYFFQFFVLFFSSYLRMFL